MTAGSHIVVASQGPFGPTVSSCLVLIALLVGPFVLLALAARSLLGVEPLSGWLLGLVLIGTACLAYVLWHDDARGVISAFWKAWRAAGYVSLVLLPAVLARESVKRGWLSSLGRGKRVRRRSGRAKSRRVD